MAEASENVVRYRLLGNPGSSKYHNAELLEEKVSAIIPPLRGPLVQ